MRSDIDALLLEAKKATDTSYTWPIKGSLVLRLATALTECLAKLDAIEAATPAEAPLKSSDVRSLPDTPRE